MLRWSWIQKPASKRVYLDYAAATPMRRDIVREMTEVYKELYANPSAIHAEGVAARERIEESRQTLARTLSIRPEGVIFTGSGTESNNLAIYGLLRQLQAAGRSYDSMTVLSTKLEHPSVSEVLTHLKAMGVRVVYVAVDSEGLIDEQQFAKALDKSVVLVTCAYVNSEVGVIEPVGRLTRVVKKFNSEHATAIRVHVDAAQAPLWLNCALDRLGVDLLSLDAGKCYGPKGVGVLAMRHGVSLKPVVRGGGQEFGLRAATENTAGIVGAAAAIVYAQSAYTERAEVVQTLRDRAIAELTAIDGVVLNGSPTKRVANNINISIAGVDGEFAVVTLDERGIAVSTKSACAGASGGGSTVVETISGDAARARSTIRITLGEETSWAELKRCVDTLREHVASTRKAMNSLTPQ